MIIKFIEATNRETGGFNWGKFMVARFDTEWQYKSMVGDFDLLAGRGWAPEHILVFDLETGEGALFRPGGLADYDLNKKRIWVCPMFEPFLEWLYKQELTDLTALPAHVILDSPSAYSGYRRPGTFINAVWCLIFCMAERGHDGKDPWFGQEFLRVKELLEQMGFNCDPEKVEIEPPPELNDKIKAILARTKPD